jgi:hypothetical protein
MLFGNNAGKAFIFSILPLQVFYERQAILKYYNMKTFILVVTLALLVSSCGPGLKLFIPPVFKEQATAQHVDGARKRYMSVAGITTTKIRRGIHSTYPGWSRGFLLENILLNNIGLQKEEHVQKEKDKFQYIISDGKNRMQVFGKERKLTKSIKYKLLEKNSILNSFEQVQQAQYIFAAQLVPDSSKGAKSWDLIMSNGYDRKKSGDNSLFTILRPDDEGLVTNGTDTIFIRPVSTRETENLKGQKGRFPIKLLAGYELSSKDGVIAIIDLISHDVWFYNELEASDRLTIAAITTAIFARRVNDNKW